MELPVQYRNKEHLVWLIMLVGTVYMLAAPRSAPLKRINSADPLLTHREGYVYYNAETFTGILFSNYVNGNPERETPYYQGKEDGIMQAWYPDKSREQERLFIDGKKEGTHHGWWADGKPKFEYQFNNDEHDGTAKEWFKDGRLYRCFRYTAGHEEGLQQMWWADGKVRANYVVKDGVQYGLIGRKFCKNVFNK
jgi:antitoxin component YwqK of YwqJK toxin-antitoxin module